jgi:hypothetical protein
MDGMSQEIDGGPVKAMPSGESGIYRRRAEMIEGELGGKKKIRPAIRGKGDVTGRQDGQEMVPPCANGPFHAISSVVLGGNVLHLDNGLEGVEESGEFGGSLIVHLNIGNGARVRREESTGRTKNMDIRGRGARLEGKEMDVVAVQKDKNIFETVVRWDGKTTGKVSRSPFAAGIGAGASDVGRKGRSRG